MNSEQLYLIKEAFELITIDVSELNQRVLKSFNREMNITPISINFVITWHDECILFYGDIPVWEYVEERHSSFTLKDYLNEMWVNLISVLKGVKIAYKMLKENIDSDNISLEDYENDNSYTIEILRDIISDNSDILRLPTFQEKMVGSEWECFFGEVKLDFSTDFEGVYGQIMAICEISKKLYKELKKLKKERK